METKEEKKLLEGMREKDLMDFKIKVKYLFADLRYICDMFDGYENDDDFRKIFDALWDSYNALDDVSVLFDVVI